MILFMPTLETVFGLPVYNIVEIKIQLIAMNND